MSVGMLQRLLLCFCQLQPLIDFSHIDFRSLLLLFKYRLSADFVSWTQKQERSFNKWPISKEYLRSDVYLKRWILSKLTKLIRVILWCQFSNSNLPSKSFFTCSSSSLVCCSSVVIDSSRSSKLEIWKKSKVEQSNETIITTIWKCEKFK